MRIVVCADAHLDSAFPIFNKNDRKLLLRREEQKVSFSKVIDEVKRIDAHVLLIPGDLFCADKVSEDTISFLRNSFASIENTIVVITPGNNDPATADSPYITSDWPNNVVILKKELEAFELTFDDTGETARIYGAGFRGHICKSSLLRNSILPILDKNYINLLIMHGDLCAKGTPSDYNPIFIEDVNTCGFDFCALGHKHQFTGVLPLEKSNYAYTGPCEGRNFFEAGPCGVLSGNLTKDSIDLSFVKTSTRENLSINIDISDVENQEDLIKKIKSECGNTENIYKVTLTGTLKSNAYISISKLKEKLSCEYFYIKIVPEYYTNMNLDTLRLENSLKGCFVRNIEKKLVSCDDKDSLYDALSFGLNAFESEDILNENS